MTQKATFASGCFWCYEPIFEMLKGVVDVTVGYSGGHQDSPSYEEVSRESTGHAESYQIEFDPEIISYEQLLDIFFFIHNPTTVNRQGPDYGSQYRSVIFYHDDNQKQQAEKSKEKHQSDFDDPIVTEIVKFEEFFLAEDYHQDFFDKNLNYPYCTVNIGPKIKKLKKEFSSLLK